MLDDRTLRRVRNQMRCGFADMLLGSPRFLGLPAAGHILFSDRQPAHQSDSDSVRLRLEPKKKEEKTCCAETETSHDGLTAALCAVLCCAGARLCCSAALLSGCTDTPPAPGPCPRPSTPQAMSMSTVHMPCRACFDAVIIGRRCYTRRKGLSFFSLSQAQAASGMGPKSGRTVTGRAR